MVSPKYANEIQEFFQNLNPYHNNDVQIFKIEKSNDGKPLENVLFYGISSKRYALFENHNDPKNKFNICKFTSHGFAHLLDVDERQWWHDILKMHYHPESKQMILGKYDSRYAVSKMSITTPNALKRFSNLRPFDKILVGTGYSIDKKGNAIVPTLPYLDARKSGCIQYMPFANYSTGETFQDSADDTLSYWKPLSETLDDYANHKEAKSGGDIGGLLPRLGMKISKNTIKFVGKETANLDTANTIGIEDNYTIYDNLADKILGIRPSDSYKLGISRSNLISLQKKIGENGMAKLHKKTIEKLKRVFSGAVSENLPECNRNDTGGFGCNTSILLAVCGRRCSFHKDNPSLKIIQTV